MALPSYELFLMNEILIVTIEIHRGTVRDDDISRVCCFLKFYIFR